MILCLSRLLLAAIWIQSSLDSPNILLLAGDQPIENLCLPAFDLQCAISLQPLNGTFDDIQLVLKVVALLHRPVVAVAQCVVKWEGEIGSQFEQNVSLVGHGLLDTRYADGLVGGRFSKIFPKLDDFVTKLLNVLTVGLEPIIESCFVGCFIVVVSFDASHTHQQQAATNQQVWNWIGCVHIISNGSFGVDTKRWVVSCLGFRSQWRNLTAQIKV